MKLLAKSDLDRIIRSVPSIADRGSLLSHLVRAGSYNGPRKVTKPPSEKEQAQSREDLAKAIRQWLAVTYSPNTVRSKAVERMLEAMESGEITTGE